MSKLEWLARNLREWPKNVEDAKRTLANSGFYLRGDYIIEPDASYSVHKTDWYAECKRLDLDDGRNKWDDEGLPLVGTVCEVLNSCMAHPEYERCTIHFIGEYAVVYTSESCKERMAQLGSVKFRHIRTEDEKAVEDMSIVLAGENTRVVELVTDKSTFVGAAKALYKAGYRKIE